MTFQDLIRNHHWLSIETELLRLYPDQKSQCDAYREVFEGLLRLVPDESAIVIRLSECTDEEEPYVQVDGYHADGRIDPQSGNDALALDFTPWEEWLGMKVDPSAFLEFTDLEIIAHCLYEMTFIAFDQNEIRQQLESLKKTAEELENMTPEEREKNTISLDDLLKGLEDDEG